MDLKHLFVTLKDLEGATVGSLERSFVAVAADEDVIGCLEVVRNVFQLLTVPRRHDGAKALDFFTEASEEL